MKVTKATRTKLLRALFNVAGAKDICAAFVSDKAHDKERGAIYERLRRAENQINGVLNTLKGDW